MRYDVNFGIKNKTYTGVAKVENDRIDLCAAPEHTAWSVIFGFLGMLLGTLIGGVLFIVLFTWLGTYIGRSISKSQNAETVHFSFHFKDVIKISHLVTDNRALYRVYINRDPSNFIKIMCACGTNFDSFMKTTFADVITEVEH